MAKFEPITYNPAAEKKLEQLIFTAVRMSTAYEKVYEEESTVLESKKQEIINTHTLSDIYNHLEIEPRFRLSSDDDENPLSIGLTPNR